MLYHLLFPLTEDWSIFNVFRYLTFRAALAALSALCLTVIYGPWVIRRLRSFEIGQIIRDEGPKKHHEKAGTPTMGGMLIITAICIPTVLWADLSNRFIWVALLATISFGIIGFIDDYQKIAKSRSTGLTVTGKLLLQFAISGLIAVILYYFTVQETFTTAINVPFVKTARPELGLFYIPFVMLVLASCTNAVNFTDGLDGLAVGSSLFAAMAFTVFVYIAGNAIYAKYLDVVGVPTVGEIAVFGGSLIGACLGFLWFNFYPAEVFMGDTGSMALGGAIGILAILSKQEILLIVVGGLFVIELLSVVLQVGSFKLRKKRIFKMAPLHHHFELIGWQEPKIVVRLWIVAIIFAIAGLATLKLR